MILLLFQSIDMCRIANDKYWQWRCETEHERFERHTVQIARSSRTIEFLLLDSVFYDEIWFDDCLYCGMFGK